MRSLSTRVVRHMAADPRTTKRDMERAITVHLAVQETERAARARRRRTDRWVWIGSLFTTGVAFTILDTSPTGWAVGTITFMICIITAVWRTT